MVCITFNRDVTPCSIIRKGFGNIHNSSFEKIVKDNKNELLFLHFREPKNISGHCSVCENNPICWGCRATAYSKSGDIFGIDPNCYVK
jgi:radical SAM protein with 4Fe4S-binding SPASM domain